MSNNRKPFFKKTNPVFPAECCPEEPETATGIVYDPEVSGLEATTVQDAIDEVDANLDSHINEAVGAHEATAISYDPTVSGLASIEVQGAIDELAALIPAPSILAQAMFYALMPGDNAATVAVGAAVEFPQNGPQVGSGIPRLGPSTFELTAIGTYEVHFQVSVDEPGQLSIALGGVDVPYTIVGRATGTSQITGMALVTTLGVGEVLSINNPVGNPAALTVTPTAGGANAVSASLLIKRVE